MLDYSRDDTAKNFTMRLPDSFREQIERWLVAYNERHTERLTVSDFFRLAAYKIIHTTDPRTERIDTQ